MVALPPRNLLKCLYYMKKLPLIENENLLNILRITTDYNSDMYIDYNSDMYQFNRNKTAPKSIIADVDIPLVIIKTQPRIITAFKTKDYCKRLYYAKFLMVIIITASLLYL